VYVASTKPLFAWDCLQDSPSLSTIKHFLVSIPDARLLEGYGGIAVADAMTAPYLLPGESFYCGSPCGT
jgi:hypothetical protein